MLKTIVILSSGLMLTVSKSSGQNEHLINTDLLTDYWEAQWISHPTSSTVDFGVYHFRKTFSVDGVPESFVVHASGDNRYDYHKNVPAKL